MITSIFGSRIARPRKNIFCLGRNYKSHIEETARAANISIEETRRVMEALSQAIVNKVLHTPTVKLRDSSRAGNGARFVELVSEIFGLSGPGRRHDRGEPGR